jgi:hypothetical protein
MISRVIFGFQSTLRVENVVVVVAEGVVVDVVVVVDVDVDVVFNIFSFIFRKINIHMKNINTMNV